MDKATFQTKKWRCAAICAYVGMNIGVLLITSTLPLTFIGLGALSTNSSDLSNVALHCISFKHIQYWLVGMGGLTLLSQTLGLLAAIGRNKKFRYFAIGMLAVVTLLVIILLGVGNAENDRRKTYFQNTWTEMDDDTKHFLEGYFSCCGFENETEWSSSILPLNESCYAIESENITWPDGCYERITSSTLSPVTVLDLSGQSQTIGVEKTNPLLVAYIVSLIFLFLSLLVSIIMFAIAMISTPLSIEKVTSDSMVLENKMSEETHNKDIVEGNLTKVNPRSEDAISTTANEHVGANGESNGNSKPITNGKTNDVLHEDVDTISNKSDKGSCSSSVGDYISSALGNAFFSLGVQVGKHPKMTIVYSLLLTVSFTIGILQRYDPPPGSSSSFLADDNPRIEEFILYSSTFVIRARDQRLLIVDDTDVLSSENYLTTLNIDKSVKALSSSSGKNFNSICLNLDGNCKERSLFEFWSFNNTELDNLSTPDLLTKISASPLTSPVFNDNVDVSHILGGIERGSTDNDIISAKAHLLHYVTLTRGDNWEELFIDLGKESYSGVTVYVHAASSRSLESSSGYDKELPLLFAGFGLIFIYIIVMAGKLSLLEHRVYIALMGVSTAGLSMGAGIGISASFGLKWSVLHLIVPFLVIGIGVDDMFVILQAWNGVEDDADLKNKSLPEKAGHVLKSAGVSITVTSVTDLVAFAVGATSGLGGFASFSVYVAMCIILLFFLQCTFFMACIVLDQRRKDDRYDACLACCYKHKDTYKAGKCSEKEFFQTFFEDVLGRLVTKLPFAIIAILITLGITGLMGWGFYNLPVRYDPDWYLPVDSYLVDFGKQYDSFFNVGSDGAAYVIGTDFYTEREKLHALYERLKANTNIDTSYLSSWFESYVSWAGTTKGISNVYATDAFSSSTEFYASVKEYLYTSGTKYIYDVVLQSDVIVGSKFEYRHIPVSDESENIEIVESIAADCNAVNFDGRAFPYGSFYLIYEITRIIREEVYRNLGITLLCVFVVVLPILASFQMGFWVGLCVVFTTVDVAGTMYFAGLSIEASTIITLLLSVGLAVDYAAHVGHKFLTLKGTRKMRVRVTMGQIGLAVFNGGFSTFLALVLLAGSETYSFRVFFTVFSCVIGFGLWNGLIFLPCILGLIGPPANSVATEARLTTRHYHKKNKIKNSESGTHTEEI